MAECRGGRDKGQGAQNAHIPNRRAPWCAPFAQPVDESAVMSSELSSLLDTTRLEGSVAVRRVLGPPLLGVLVEDFDDAVQAVREKRRFSRMNLGNTCRAGSKASHFTQCVTGPCSKQETPNETQNEKRGAVVQGERRERDPG